MPASITMAPILTWLSTLTESSAAVRVVDFRSILRNTTVSPAPSPSVSCSKPPWASLSRKSLLNSTSTWPPLNDSCSSSLTHSSGAKRHALFPRPPRRTRVSAGTGMAPRAASNTRLTPSVRTIWLQDQAPGKRTVLHVVFERDLGAVVAILQRKGVAGTRRKQTPLVGVDAEGGPHRTHIRAQRLDDALIGAVNRGPDGVFGFHAHVPG